MLVEFFKTSISQHSKYATSQAITTLESLAQTLQNFTQDWHSVTIRKVLAKYLGDRISLILMHTNAHTSMTIWPRCSKIKHKWVENIPLPFSHLNLCIKNFKPNTSSQRWEIVFNVAQVLMIMLSQSIFDPFDE